MTELTGLGKTIIAADPIEIKLDHTVKSILAYKPLLARILKETVSECSTMTPDEIESCIEGDVQISSVYVDSGLTNAGERIDGLATEAYLNGEGLSRYDIRTYLKVPGDSGHIKLLVNVEAQNDDRPGYDLSLRALFYCCRMISAQQGVEFTTDRDDPVKYGNIKKVYSIWICTETSQNRANSIEKYDLRRAFLAGTNEDTPRYDIMNAVLVNISRTHDTGGTDNELIRLLTDLFDERLSGAEKVGRLKSDYGLKTTREVEREVDDMCTYGAAMENKGMEKGLQKGMEKGMQKGMEKGMEKGLQILVRSLKYHAKDFESLYADVIRNEEYKSVTREEVKRYMQEV